jgi:hypothetical protein
MCPEDELASLTNLLRALEAGEITHRQNGIDISQRDIEKLKLDIQFLNSTLEKCAEK